MTRFWAPVSSKGGISAKIIEKADLAENAPRDCSGVALSALFSPG
jgi:hypothetical protein